MTPPNFRAKNFVKNDGAVLSDVLSLSWVSVIVRSVPARGREFREFREFKEFKEYREGVIYSVNTLAKFLKFPILLIFPNHPPPNFVSEWCRCGVVNFHQR